MAEKATAKKSTVQNPAGRNISLIGLPGVGKTTSGKLLAKKLGWDFIDTDERIENHTGITCARFIEEYGESEFRLVEAGIIRDIFGKVKSTVISVGGGAVEMNDEVLGHNSIVVYLDREPEDIIKTLDIKAHPLSKTLDDLEELRFERMVDYSRCCDIKIDATDSPGATMRLILEKVTPVLNGAFLVINGPNMRLLGIREPEIYGADTLDDLERLIADHSIAGKYSVICMQSNSEGEIIDYINDAYFKLDGIVLNPGAYTHYSYAIHDAIKAISGRVPTIEVHISDINSREEWRRVSVTAPACIAQISGHGFKGYTEALDILYSKLHGGD